MNPHIENIKNITPDDSILEVLRDLITRIEAGEEPHIMVAESMEEANSIALFNMNTLHLAHIVAAIFENCPEVMLLLRFLNNS